MESKISHSAGNLGLADLGCLGSSSAAPPLRRRSRRGLYEASRRPERTAPRDDRGPVVRTAETAQTSLTAAGVDTRVGD